MKSTWSTACGGRAGCKRFASDKKRLAKGKDLNNIVDYKATHVL